MVVAGFLLMWKTEWIYQNFGTIAWAEMHFHSMGGSRLFYKSVGICLILLGFLTMTGLMADLGKALLPRFFYSVTPQE